MSNIHSVTDQVVKFEPEFLEMRRSMPQLDLSGFTGWNQKGWMHPLLNKIRLEMNELGEKLNVQLRRNKMRKEMKIESDPWENFLVHDSQHFLPIINHTKALEVEAQVIVFLFVKHVIDSETSSQYTEKPGKVAQSFLAFAEEF